MKSIQLLTIVLVMTINSAAQSLPDGMTIKKDIIYKSVNGWDGKMDVYYPSVSSKIKPLVIYIHGGGWLHGRKEDEYPKIEVLVQQGYVVANVEYRLAQVAPAPAAVEDVRCAFCYLLKNAQKFKIDVRNVFMMGASAGGHLALMAGLLGNNNIFDAGCSMPEFRIAGIIDKYGPADLLHWGPIMKLNKPSSTWIANRTTDTLYINSVSPINYVNVESPAVLIIHGDNDHTVPITQSEMLFKKLKDCHVDAEFFIVKGGKHGNFSTSDIAVMNRRMITFIEKHLK
jgi:acetyl esterase/lipase